MKETLMFSGGNMIPFILILSLSTKIKANPYGQPEVTVRVHPSPQDAPQINVRVIDPPVSKGTSQSEPFHVTIPILSFSQSIQGSESSRVEFTAESGISGFMSSEEDPNNGDRYVDDKEWPSSQQSAFFHESSDDIASEGLFDTLTWTDDENGFHMPAHPFNTQDQPVESDGDAVGVDIPGHRPSPVRFESHSSQEQDPVITTQPDHRTSRNVRFEY